MISDARWAVIRRIERYALWLTMPSLAAMFIAIYAGAQSGLVVWLVLIALLFGSVWMGIHLGLGPLLTGQARLSFIVYSVPVPEPLARFVGAFYLVMSVIGVLLSALLLIFAT